MTEALKTYEDIRYERDGHKAIITIDREHRGNSFRRQTLDEINDAVVDAGERPGIRILVLTAAGQRFFSTGGDVNEYHHSYRGNMAAFRSYQRAIEVTCGSIIQSAIPVIARLNGIVAGGSNAFHLAADITVASENTVIQQVGVKIGSVSGLGPNQWWPLTIGDKRSRELLLTGKRLDAQTALEWGAFNAVVPQAELDAEVDRWVEQIITGFPDALRYTRLSLNGAKELAFREITQAREWLQLHFPSTESAEGFAAFAERRDADAEFSWERVEDGEVTVAPHGGLRRQCPECGTRGLAEKHRFCGICGAELAQQT